jgi:hypothetical protein
MHQPRTSCRRVSKPPPKSKVAHYLQRVYQRPNPKYATTNRNRNYHLVLIFEPDIGTVNHPRSIFLGVLWI